MSKYSRFSYRAERSLLGPAGILAFCCGIILLYRFAVLPPYQWLFLLLIVLLPLLFLESSRLHAVFVWLMWAGVGLSWAAWHADSRLTNILPSELEGIPLTVSGYVCDLPQPGSFNSLRFTLCVHRWHQPPEMEVEAALPLKVRLAWYGSAHKVLPSQQLKLLVVLKRPHGTLNHAGFRYEDWLFRHGVRATGSVRKLESAPEVPCRLDCTYRAWHRGMAAIVERYFGAAEHYPLIASLLMGNRGHLSPDHWVTLKATGTIHLVAISGLHLGLVALASGMIGRRMMLLAPSGMLSEHRIRNVVFAMVLLCCLIYGLLAGMTVPTQRALVMVVVGGWYILKAQEISPWYPFVVALGLVLLVDPFAPLDQGFWLSFAAVALLLSVFAGRLGAPGWLAGLVIAQCAVFAGLWPILDELGQGQPAAGLIANMVAIPWVSFVVMPVLFLGSLLTLASGGVLADVSINLFDAVLGVLWFALEMAQSMPMPELRSVSLPVLLTLAVITVIAVRFPDGRFRVISGLAILSWLVLGLPAAPEASNSSVPEPEVRIWDVGQGLSVLVRSGQEVLLYDTGPEVEGVFSAVESVLIPNLKALGVKRLDRLVISHGDSDHSGGLPQLLAKTSVGLLSSGEPEKVQQKLRVESRPDVALCSQETHRLGNLELSFWRSHSGRSGNDASCVLRVLHPESETDLILAGDVSRKVEAEMLADPEAGWLSGFEGRRILIAPHHGSKTSSSTAWIAAARPDWVVYTAGYQHRFGHPHRDVVQRYMEAGAYALNTACSGQLTITFTAGGPEIDEARGGGPFWISGPGLTRDQCKIP
ncbi:DNA internalization-related competence protein ComEC/Rec2 [Marinobacter sp.]|uniref:DNA internalization-related competence protein ComEC/Rec2 n=1 Tax=Marinobacter sp. TaxID=50741 RepID=UPI003565994D